MKRVKLILVLMIVMIGALFLFGTTNVYAATIQVQAQVDRPYNDSDSNGTNGTNEYTLKNNIMVKLYEQNRGSTFSPTFPDAIYCMRGNLGFGYNGFLNSGNPLAYDLIGNMYANSSAVLTQYNKIITGNGGTAMTTANYNAILWIINQMYLPRNANAAELRTQLLTDAGISTTSSMTADDIEIVQQAAIWYFSNYDTNGQANSVSLDQTSATPVSLTNVLQINGVQLSAGTTGRYADMNTLYTYLVSQAKANSAVAPSPTITAPTLTLSKTPAPAIATTQSTVATLGSPFYIIGPFNITSAGNITDTNLAVTPVITYNGSSTLTLDTAAMGASGLVNAYISDANGNQIVQGGNKVYDMTDMVGKGQFYIAVRQAGATSNISAFNLKINYTYSYFNTTVADFYVSNENMTSGTYTDQPLLVVDKEKKTGSGTDNVGTAVFDLALRKYITAVNGVNVAASRTPVINTNTLTSGTTATYNHRKDPVQVKTGDTVTYAITVYNEGSMTGRATEITDQLPAGLQYVGLNSANAGKYTANYNSTTNVVTFTEAAGNADLNAYPGTGTLASATILIDCKVTDTITGNNTDILTNVAWISKDSSGNPSTDRDSEPSTVPSVNQTGLKTTDPNMGYTGNSGNKTDLTDSNYFYKGLEDEDDFEKVELTPVFDLSLRKFISSVDGTALTGTAARTPALDTSKLEAGTATTAVYNHSKVPVHLKAGSKVVYTIRVYNEGNAPGAATKVTDYLPAGLTYDAANPVNATYGWTANGQQVSSTYLAGTTIPAFDPAKTVAGTATNWQKATAGGTSGLYYADLQIGCIVSSTANEGDILTNIAEITTDSSGTTSKDRDSQPGNVNYNTGTTPTYKDTEINRGDSYIPGQQDDDDFDKVIVDAPQVLDLSLRKFISSINGTAPAASRVPAINTTNLANGTSTTATYTHPKNALPVNTGDTVVYTIRVYNEGELSGTATSIVDYLPAGLTLKTGSTINTTYGWTADPANSSKITSTYLATKPQILAFDSAKTAAAAGETWQKAASGPSGLSYADVQVECTVAATVTTQDQNLRNIAEIYSDSSGTTSKDRDSKPNNVNTGAYNPPADNSSYQQDDDDYEQLVLQGKVFDLSLRKFISSVNGTALTGNSSRVPVLDTSKLEAGTDTTATYTHPKTAVEVKTGDTVVYTIRVYNEGDLPGTSTKTVDYLPAGLTLKTGSTINTTYGWTADPADSTKITSAYLASQPNIPAFDSAKTSVGTATNWQKSATGASGLYYADLQVECTVTANVTGQDQILRNIAEIAADNSPAGNHDVDSTPGNVNKGNYNPPADNSKYQEDDDDYEPLILPGKTFDLSLQKWISNVNGTMPSPDRTPKIDLSKLNKIGSDGKEVTTATYTHPQDALVVKQGDIVTFTVRVYNEGDRDGYASQIKDQIPAGLGLLLNYKTNYDNGWAITPGSSVQDLVGANGFYQDASSVKNLKAGDFVASDGTPLTSFDGVQIVKGAAAVTTDILKYDSLTPEANVIKGYDPSKLLAGTDKNWQAADVGGSGLYYRDVQITCIVLAPNTSKDVLTNVAQISKAQNENGGDMNNPGDDRDSVPDNNVPTEDDQDHDQVQLKYFDLSLKKFIASVLASGGTATSYDRAPAVTIPADFMNPGTDLTYTFPKEKAQNPVNVVSNDTVIYTLRVYNEGTEAGYANEIRDNVPAGLEYIPGNSINQKYGWQMYDSAGAVTTDPTKAVEIRTAYLSQENGTGNELKPFDAGMPISTVDPKNPDYKDVQIAFKVLDTGNKDPKNVIINTAEITKDSGDDVDSTPNNNKAGEDDQDNEYIHTQTFDLALIKYVTKSTLTVGGKTTTTQYQMPSDDAGSGYLVKVDIGKNNVNQTAIKFTYTLKVTNTGEIAGSAKEITDKIPDGLQFVAADNPQWKAAGSSAATTDALNGTILQPGQSATVPITLTWVKSGTNTGTKDNVAVITGFYNEHGSPDSNSHNNQDNALVMITIKTGGAAAYIPLIAGVLAILGIGVFLIKRYVV